MPQYGMVLLQMFQERKYPIYVRDILSHFYWDCLGIEAVRKSEIDGKRERARERTKDREKEKEREREKEKRGIERKKERERKERH